jgi:transposase-like protein
MKLSFPWQGEENGQKGTTERKRLKMVAAVRKGASMRSVARRFHVSLLTVQRWVRRANGSRLDRVDWTNHPRGRRRPVNRTSRRIEARVLAVRHELKHTSDLGDAGAVAIRAELVRRRSARVPSVRTIGRILGRSGALDGRQRPRRKAPPRGWYLPEVAAARAEVDCFDVIEGLVIRGGPEVQVLTAASLLGGLVAAWPMRPVNAQAVVQGLTGHWREAGLPTYAQFDNDTRFQGPHHIADTVGRVTRLCLSLGVVPVFVPPQETGFQATIENLNGRWQAKVWARFHHESQADLDQRSARYISASRRKASERIDAAPARTEFPRDWQLDLQVPPRGQIIYLRRTGERGEVTLLGHGFKVDPAWAHRLVRSVVDLDAGRIRFYALRRREPGHQPLLAEAPYELPRRPFME